MKGRSTRATTMSCRYPAMLSRRIKNAAPDVDLLNDNECITRQKKSSIKRFKAERNRNSEHWILKLNQDGAQQPLNQRPDFATRRTYGKEPAGKKNHSSKPTSKTKKRKSVRRNWRRRLCSRSLHGLEVPWQAQRNLSPSSPSSSSTKWERNNWTTRSWNSWHSSRLTIRETFFSELGPVSGGREINFPTTDGWCIQNTHSHDTFVHVQVIRTLPA